MSLQTEWYLEQVPVAENVNLKQVFSVHVNPQPASGKKDVEFQLTLYFEMQ